METTNNIYAALSRAQATYTSAQKSGYNPHYKSSFSTFEDLVLASRESLVREGLSVCQYLNSENDKDHLVTLLMHSSGETIKSTVRIYVKDNTDIQKFGSAMSYLKRYVYASICGIATSEHDDDGESMLSEPLITDKQVWYVRSFIKGDQELEDKICRHYGVKDLKYMPAKYVNQIVDKLKENESKRATVTEQKYGEQAPIVEKITGDQLDELYLELQEYPIMTESLKKSLGITHLSEMPKSKYTAQMQNIRKQKIALMNSPKKEW